MKTPYIKHTFGDEVDRKLRGRGGWLTAGVASSISFPSFDVHPMLQTLLSLRSLLRVDYLAHAALPNYSG
jgi:hypothetical protein